MGRFVAPAFDSNHNGHRLVRAREHAPGLGQDCKIGRNPVSRSSMRTHVGGLLVDALLVFSCFSYHVKFVDPSFKRGTIPIRNACGIRGMRVKEAKSLDLKNVLGPGEVSCGKYWGPTRMYSITTCGAKRFVIFTNAYSLKMNISLS